MRSSSSSPGSTRGAVRPTRIGSIRGASASATSPETTSTATPRFSTASRSAMSSIWGSCAAEVSCSAYTEHSRKTSTGCVSWK